MIEFSKIRNFDDIVEFHNIMPIKNIPSILNNGILSYNKMKQLYHNSIAMPTIQDKRENITIPNGHKLHDYANMYFHARNPMMYKKKNEDICVLRINKDILKYENVIFSDRNASSNYARFLGINQVNTLDYEKIYSLDWNDEDMFQYFEKKSKKCAEILIINKIELKYIIGAYVKNEKDRQKMLHYGFCKPITINKEIFFL